MSRAEGESGVNMLRITLWFATSGLLWIAGALLAEGPARLWWWIAALAIEYAGPFSLFYVPFLGRSTVREWTISGHHMAERAALFMIIALGEGIVVTGATFAGHEMSGGRTAAFLIAFAGSVMMWWIYFDVGAKRGAELIAHHAEPGRVARNAYTYLHMPIVAAIVAGAVSDELLLAHPEGHAGQAAGGLPVRRAGGVPGRRRLVQAHRQPRGQVPAVAPRRARTCSRRSRCGPGWSRSRRCASGCCRSRCWWWWRSGSGARSTADGRSASRAGGPRPRHSRGRTRHGVAGPEGEGEVSESVDRGQLDALGGHLLDGAADDLILALLERDHALRDRERRGARRRFRRWLRCACRAVRCRPEWRGRGRCSRHGRARPRRKPGRREPKAKRRARR